MDQIEALRSEVREFKDTRYSYQRGLDKYIDLRSDVSDIKIAMQCLRKQSAAPILNNEHLPPNFLRPFHNDGKFEKFKHQPDHSKKSYSEATAGVAKRSTPTGQHENKIPLTKKFRDNGSAFRKKNTGILGTRPSSSSAVGLRASTLKIYDLYVGGFEKTFGVQDVIDHCKIVGNIEVTACKELDSKSKFSVFQDFDEN